MKIQSHLYYTLIQLILLQTQLIYSLEATPADFDLDEASGFIALEDIKNIKRRKFIKIFLFSSNFSKINYMNESRDHVEFESFENIYKPESIIYLQYNFDEYEESIVRETLYDTLLNYEKIKILLLKKAEQENTPKTPLNEFKGVFKVSMNTPKSYDLKIEKIEFDKFTIKIEFKNIYRKKANYLDSNTKSVLKFSTNINNERYVIRLADKLEIEKIIKILIESKETTNLELIALTLFVILDIVLLLTVFFIFYTLITKKKTTELII